MKSSYIDPVPLRDRGMDYLKKGKEMYNNRPALEEKERGYLIFKQGLQYIVDYLKVETNAEFKKKTKENLTVWMKDCELMSQNIQAQGGNTSKILPTANPTPTQQSTKTTDTVLKKSVSTNRKPDIDEESKDAKSPTKKKEPLKEDDNKKMVTTLESAIVTEKPNVKWDDVCGLEGAKKALQEAVILPIRFPQLFVGSRTPWKGILLYGPPGTGKTFLAKACATEAEATFFSISSSDLISKWVGESEKLIKTLFSMARDKKPAIIFIDEIDSLLSARSDNENEASRRVKTEFLIQMQGVGHDDRGILVLGATNLPWGLDPAVRRRFEKRIYIPLPESMTREKMAKKLMDTTPNRMDEEDFQIIGEKTEGYSGSDIAILVRDACYEPLRRCRESEYFKVVDVKPEGPIYEACAPSEQGAKKMTMMDLQGDQLSLPEVTVDDFFAVLSKSKKSVSEEDILRHEEFTKLFGQEAN